MNITTYNIWNHDKNYNKRMDLLISVLKQEECDILALQEVRDEQLIKRIQSECGFTDYYWKEYFDCPEGLAILSKYPIIECWSNWDDTEDIHNSGIINVTLETKGLKLGITNVHLDYKLSFNREIEIVKAINKIEATYDVDYNLILGDFNTYPDSIIHHFMSGRQSLYEKSTSWIDLADAFSVKNHVKTEVTLDFYSNPRWDDEYALDIPGRFDWIMMKNPYPNKSPVLNDFRLIGNQRINGITPSDHYGVTCCIEF